MVYCEWVYERDRPRGVSNTATGTNRDNKVY